jgi:putative ABC transport system substrate-binding protein
MAAIKEGLGDVGYSEGQNVAFEYRWAEGRYERLPGQAADLVRHGVAVIVLVGGGPTVTAAKAATATIPIVFTMGDDPVKSGAVAALNHPGGNITGISLVSVMTEAKRFQLLHELLPHAADIGVLVNPNNPQASGQSENLQTAAHSLGLRLGVFDASSASEIDAVFAGLIQKPVDALIVAGDAFFNTRAQQLVTLSAHNAIPTMYAYRHFPAIGGLTSYGPSLAAAYRQAGNYAGRILRGEKPADLPVQQVEKFDFVINLKTAKALGLTISPNLLAIADEVIE